jgi:hypothetical protein
MEENLRLAGLEPIGWGDDDFAIVGFPLKKIIAGKLDLNLGLFDKSLELTCVNGYVLVVEVHLGDWMNFYNLKLDIMNWLLSLFNKIRKWVNSVVKIMRTADKVTEKIRTKWV